MIRRHGLDSSGLLHFRQPYVAQTSRNIETEAKLPLKQPGLSLVEHVGTDFGFGGDAQ